MSTLKLHSLVHFYAPFQRIDNEERVVEGYCYTAPRVKGDKWNLKRAALEKAAARYMEMPAVRSMHQPIAAGRGLGIEWDDRGCLLRARIVDDNEWNKVREGVYRGFSLGGRPLVARGNEIEEFDWIETSLVDRPCDPGALFTVLRAEADLATEYSVELLEPEAGPVAIERDGAEPNADVPGSEVRRVEEPVEAGRMAARSDIGRLQQLQDDNGELLIRAEAAEAALGAARRELLAAAEEVRRLRALPRERATVVGATCGLARHFAVNDLLPPGRAARRSELEQEREQILAGASAETDAIKRAETVKRILAIDHALTCL